MEDIEDCLSPEQIAAALSLAVQTYRCYFDIETGDILAISNEENSQYEQGIVIDYPLYEKFVTGVEQFKDWTVTRTKNPDSESGLEIVPRMQQELFFKNNMFEWITAKPNKKTELTVHWSPNENMWIFLISDKVRQQYYDNKYPMETLTFFITLETDFDFLVRTITIDIKDLVLDKVCVPFTSSVEEKIDKISISTKSLFSSYGLTIWKKTKE
jgi:hypothetical protein